MITDDDKKNIISDKSDSLPQSDGNSVAKEKSEVKSDELKITIDSDNKLADVPNDNSSMAGIKNLQNGKSNATELKAEAKKNEIINPAAEMRNVPSDKGSATEVKAEIKKTEAVKPTVSVKQEVPAKTESTSDSTNITMTENKDSAPVSLQKNLQTDKNASAVQQKSPQSDKIVSDVEQKKSDAVRTNNKSIKSESNTSIAETVKKEAFSTSSYKEPEFDSRETINSAEQTGVADFLSAMFARNPVFVLMLGLGPALAVTTKLTNGIGLGIIVLLTTLLSNVVISALKSFIPTKIRLPFYLTITGSIASVIIIFVKAFLPDLANSLGIFLPLTAVNSVIFERAENFACRKKIVSTVLNSLGTGIGFMLVLILISFIREFFGTLQLDFSDFGLGVYGLGKISIFGVSIYEHAKIFTLPAGAFITVGILLAVKQAVQNHFNKDIEE